MTRDLKAAQTDVLRELANHQITATADALKPLQRIDFTKLVQVYDHEERFLFDVFVSSLVTAYQARQKEHRGAGKLEEDDVRTAMLMLGSAVEAAAEQAFSAKHKPLIKQVCPYC